MMDRIKLVMTVIGCIMVLWSSYVVLKVYWSVDLVTDDTDYLWAPIIVSLGGAILVALGLY